MHPICPVVVSGGLYAFIIPSPKLNDLRRDGRYAIHSFPPEHTDDEFYVTGVAREIQEHGVLSLVREACVHPVADEDPLFEFLIERCMHAKYRERGAFPPAYTTWIAPRDE
jgi:hypothetical protein